MRTLSPHVFDRPRRRPLLVRLAVFLGIVLIAGELLYLLIANVLLFSGFIETAASKNPEKTALSWRRAWSPWPGRAYVSDLKLRVQDPVQEFGLSVAHAKVDVVLWELLRKEFRASHVQAEGVRYRMALKVDGVAGREQRLAAFPVIEGFARPALRPNPKPPPGSPADIANLWSVQLDQVDAAVTELWLLEYRYDGPARVQGGFALKPLRKLWVGPARLDMDGGKLTLGSHVVSSTFTVHAAVTLAPADLPSSPGLHIFHTVSTSIRFDTALEDLSAADVYVDGLRATGAGHLTADIEIADGKLLPATSLALSLPHTGVVLDHYAFSGAAQAALSVESAARVTATLDGTLDVPWFGKTATAAHLSKVTADLALSGDDLTQGLHLHVLDAALGEARIPHAEAITQEVGDFLPIAAPIVLGNGPLIAAATLHATPDQTVIRLSDLTLGAAELSGAALTGGKGWNGAGVGHFGALPLGLRLRDSKLQSVPFPPSPWLDAQLTSVGLAPK